MKIEKPLRKIRSFVRREGRLTTSQQQALETLWPEFGIEQTTKLIDLDQTFTRSAPRVLEIGFGMGTSLAEMARLMPDKDFLGIEVHRPGVGSLLKQIDKQGLTNLRVLCADAIEILEHQIPDSSLDMVLLFFPDPWHKKRHHKRRIVQLAFLDLLALKIKQDGIIHMATDWEDYAIHMMNVLTTHPDFANTYGNANYAERPDYRPVTKFELRGKRLGHGVWDLIFKRL
jgi:tRNA (guanine-N7-)-methyltransferase